MTTQTPTNSPIQIVFIHDDAYATHTGVALCSIFENHHTSTPIEVYIIDGGISEENKSRLQSLVSSYKSTLTFLPIDINRFEKFPVFAHLKIATWYRLLLPELLPHIDTVLYLDSDIVCIDEIEPLYKTTIENYLCAAVDGNPAKSSNNPHAGTYFNSGMLLINLAKWRTERISEKCFQFVENSIAHNQPLRYMDQDTLNAVLTGRWLNVPFRYNYMEPIVMATTPQIMRDICVIHYINAHKPWHPDSFNSLDHYYFEYRAKTPWKDIDIYPKRNLKQYAKRYAVITMLTIKKSGLNFLITPLTAIKRLFGFKFY